MYKAQISDGEQIECADYEVGEQGVELYDEDDEFMAFVPFGHLVYVGNVDERSQTVW